MVNNRPTPDLVAEIPRMSFHRAMSSSAMATF